jgi:hypothetical protein
LSHLNATQLRRRGLEKKQSGDNCLRLHERSRPLLDNDGLLARSRSTTIVEDSQ